MRFKIIFQLTFGILHRAKYEKEGGVFQKKVCPLGSRGPHRAARGFEVVCRKIEGRVRERERSKFKDQSKLPVQLWNEKCNTKKKYFQDYTSNINTGKKKYTQYKFNIFQLF